MTIQQIKEDIRLICTYHSELGEGTSGYSLSEEQFEKLFDLFEKRDEEVREEAEKELWKFAIEQCDSFDPDMVGIHRCSAGHCGHCGVCDVLSELLLKTK